jgi:hypothetical protein
VLAVRVVDLDFVSMAHDAPGVGALTSETTPTISSERHAGTEAAALIPPITAARATGGDSGDLSHIFTPTQHFTNITSLHQHNKGIKERCMEYRENNMEGIAYHAELTQYDDK